MPIRVLGNQETLKKMKQYAIDHQLEWKTAEDILTIIRLMKKDER